MDSDISGRLARVIEKRRLKHKLEQDLSEVERSLEVKSAQLEALEQQLKKEQVDLVRLERLSLAGLFYAVLGSKEEQVEKERQEALAAQLKHQQAQRVVDALRADRLSLRLRLEDLRGVEDDYAALAVEKERLLRRENSPLAAELMRLSEDIAHRQAEEREIDEAVAAANDVLASLEKVIDSLQGAEAWGAWDLLGGGFLSTAIKHSRIDDAHEAAQETQVKMSRFTRELADVQRSTDLTIDIGGLDTFADFFLDGLIVDWIVQAKIQNSLEHARQAGSRITTVVGDLTRLRAGIQAQVQSLNEQRARLIEGA